MLTYIIGGLVLLTIFYYAMVMRLRESYKPLIYVVCPVRIATPEQTEEVAAYVAELEEQGYRVHFPPRDVDQNDATGLNICLPHRDAIREAVRVDVFWDVESKGGHFDIGMAFALGKPFKIVKTYHEDNPGKSFVKVMQACNEAGY